MTPESDADLVARAVEGDGAALEEVVLRVHDPIYRLALRMAWRPADAEDAAQEILIKVITRLGSWRGEASLLTWAYRIGVNYLLNLRRTPLEAGMLTLERFGEELVDGLADTAYHGPDAELLAEEVRLSCTQALLQCLDRGERVAYVLGEVFRLPGEEASWILEITPAAYRKRLQRARQRVRTFMNGACGLVNPSAPCRCSRRVQTAIGLGRLDPERPALATHPATDRVVADAARQMEWLHDAAAVIRSHPEYAAPPAAREAVLSLLRSGRFPALTRGDAR